MNAVKKYTSTSKLPFRCFFPVIIWPGAVVLHTKSVMFRLLIFFALILSVINNIIAINIEKVFTFICGSLPAVMELFEDNIGLQSAIVFERNSLLEYGNNNDAVNNAANNIQLFLF